MKMYHGSPQKLDLLIPQKATGLNEFESKVGIFLTDTFLQAALYALGKTLKGKTNFGIAENKLVILGDFTPQTSYVYEVEVPDPLKGSHGQYSYSKKLIPIKETQVYLKDYEKYIFRVKSKNELFKFLTVTPKNI